MSSPLWTVFVIQHSHIDLGFTERQGVIADFYRQFIGQALTLAAPGANAGRAEDALQVHVRGVLGRGAVPGRV